MCLLYIYILLLCLCVSVIQYFIIWMDSLRFHPGQRGGLMSEEGTAVESKIKNRKGDDLRERLPGSQTW